MYHRKDASLNTLAGSGNVAQFVSYEPTAERGTRQTFSRVLGFEVNHVFTSMQEAVESLLGGAADGTVNVRSYTPDNPRSREFLYALSDADEACSAMQRLLSEGLHVIVNETVDVADGGVSGVVQGGLMEFSPDDTPRCVEKAGVASLPLELGVELIRTVYGFRPDLPTQAGRVEFSIHPKPRGWQATHTLLWELEETAPAAGSAKFSWPNRFSRHIGDKAYGLLMAHLAGLPVPETLVISRRVAPFSFGAPTGSREVWIRTAPREPEPGLYTTHKGWLDPFALLAREDPDNDRIASVLSQSAVLAGYSGAALFDGNGDVIVEGVEGEGDQFMLGARTRERLPDRILEDVTAAIRRLTDRFGPTRIEWVHDGRQVWIVQLHLGGTSSTPAVLVPGEADTWIDFEVDRGLEELRGVLERMPGGAGLQLRGNVGMTSHVADVVRKSGVPTRIREDRSA